MYKITAYGKTTRINKSYANYMTLAHGNGYTASAMYFKNIVNDQPLNASLICKALNDSEWTICSFKPYRPVNDGVSIIATDAWGNEDVIKITEK